ncbi:MAG: type IV pilus biogenesis protein EbsA [Prochloraceae cyanobacterium]
MSAIEQIKPAKSSDVVVYMPYYAKNKHKMLPYALGLYQQGSLEGKREIEGGEGIPFVATWFVSRLPMELTRCRLQFDGKADLNYEVTVSNSEFIEYLMDVFINFKRSRSTDFPRKFYRKLLRFD